MASAGALPPDLEIAAAQADGRTTVSVRGDVDLANADRLGRAVTEALADGDVALDLSGVSFMDSAGIRVLNTALRDAAERGRTLTVGAEMQPIVVQVLELTGMMQLLTLSEEDGA